MVNVQFEEETISREFQLGNTPRGMTGWVMNNSGGIARSEKRAVNVLLVVAIVGFFLSGFVVFKITDKPQLGPAIDPLTGEVIIPGRRSGTL